MARDDEDPKGSVWLQLRMDPKLKGRLARCAKADRRSMTAFATIAIEEAIAAVEARNAKKKTA